MAINLKTLTPHKVSRDLSGYMTYIYGSGGCGKTTFGVQAPKPLLLAFERGYNALGGDNVVPQDIVSWGEMKQVVRQLDDPQVKEMFKTIVVDTVDIASQLCEKYVCSQLGIENIGDGGWSTNGWAKVKKEWSNVFNAIAMKGYAVIFISHSKEKTMKRKDGTEYTAIVPSCSTAYNEIIRNMVDIEGYVEIDAGARHLILRSTDDTIECKSRFKYMSPKIPFSYDTLVTELNTAIDEEAKHVGEAFVVNSREVIRAAEDYDYQALMNEFNQISAAAMKADPANAGPRIVTVIESYLGKGKKIAETTPDQAELVYLIVSELKDIFKK